MIKGIKDQKVYILFIALALAVVIFLRMCSVYRNNMRLLSHDSDASYEYSVVRAYLAGCFDRYGRYPDIIGEIVSYDERDYHLKHSELFQYFPSDDRTAYELRWVTSAGLTVYEKWSRGVNIARGSAKMGIGENNAEGEKGQSRNLGKGSVP